MLPRVKRFLLGSPLRSTELHDQRLSKGEALTVFASDNLSSTAYATEEILLVLVLAGPALLHSVIPIAGAIAVLLVIVVVSYGQLIHAYPTGGGGYAVAKENLGVWPGLVAAAALMIDYVLTVAVSVAAGIAAVVSAFPVLLPHRNLLCALAVLILAVANLRGVRESARAFAVPVYAFVVGAFLLIAAGLYRHFFQGMQPQPVNVEPQLMHYSVAFLLLRGFSQGCTALTGVEAISNGVQAFRPPVSRNAQITLYIMATILGSMFLGMSYLAYLFGVVPRADGSETVVSQIARSIYGTEFFGSGFFYYFTQFATTAILILAANTCFAGFPRLASVLAEDRFVPRQFANLGDRLVFSNGIIVLSGLAVALILGFGGNVHALIPLYAIGVFLAFTLSQSGLVVHWMRARERGRGWRLAVNLLGAVTTGVVLLVIAFVKFMEGAWVIVLAVPAIMYLFWKTRRHYYLVTKQLSLQDFDRPQVTRHTVIIPVPSAANRVILTAVEYATSISKDVIAVTVNTDAHPHKEILESWKRFVDDVPLVILDSPYRSVTRPVLRFIDEIEDLRADDKVTVLLPEFVPAKWWHNFLHNQTVLALKTALLFRPGIVVTNVPHHLKE
jgi:amino acid transporter